MAKRTKCFPPKCRNKAKILTFTTSIQHYTGDSSQCSKERRKRKERKGKKEKEEGRKRKGRNLLGEKEVVSSLFADGMILYVENPKESTKILLELINKFIKVAGYKISIYK